MSDFYENSLNPALVLRNRYILALSLIALLIISSQIAIQNTIARNDDDSTVVNIAGRQCMLCQKISKAALKIVMARDLIERQAPMVELAKATALWRLSHDGLLKGSTELGLHGRNSPTVLALYEKIDASFREILEASSIIGEKALRPDVTTAELAFLARPILSREGEFLIGMNDITFQYDRETKDRLTFIRLLEYILLGVTCLTLALEALFIFLPAERQINRYFRDMKRAVTILKERATFDEMTGTFNKHTGFLILDREMEKARRLRSSVTLCFLDLDGLKAVNDAHGHEEGDLLIKTFAGLLLETIRDEDAAFRFGGDEFVLVLACDASRAVLIVERLRTAVETSNARSGRPWQLGFSSGIAHYDPSEKLSGEELIAKADGAMYRDKETHKLDGRSPLRRL